jgi:N-carbamoyl-L-amino-acid hydrolase
MAQVNGERLIQMQRQLASFGLRSDGGVSREALTPTELDARKWLCSLFISSQYKWMIDDAANLLVRRAGTCPELAPVMTGSHIDTQPVGGWLDGAYGVMAGLEAFHALDAAEIQTRRPIEVMIWTNEEGSRFSPGTMGSSAFVQPDCLPGFLNILDSDGHRFEIARDAALQATPAAEKTALGHPLHAYVETHIEQGPVLERGGYSLGIVASIQGVRWYEVTVQGNSAHAGSTPLSARHDALLSAANMVSQLGAVAVARNDDALRLTVGRFEVTPGSINTIAALVTFSVDLRHPQESELIAMQGVLENVLEQQQGTCTYEICRLMQRKPTLFDDHVLRVLSSAVAATGVSHCRLGSGAFHDAMNLSDCCPAAMLFVPSISGISHNAAENTHSTDLVAGAKALTYALVTLAST